MGGRVFRQDRYKEFYLMRSKGRKALTVIIAVFAVGAVSAGPAFASGKPTAETKPATSVGKTEATLKGVVNPNGAETKYYFEYGTNELEVLAGLKKTAEASAGSGTSNVEESKTVTGLAESTRYYFRVVATNSNGTTDGSIETFSTLPQPEFTVKTNFLAAGGTTEFNSSPGAWEYHDVTISNGEMPTKSTVAKAVVKFTGGSIGCNTSHETLTWRAVNGRLGYLNKEKKEVGLLLGEPNSELLATCEWAGTKIGTVGEYSGNIIAQITPVNTKTKLFHLTLTTKAGGEQEFTKLEGEASPFPLVLCTKHETGENCRGSGSSATISVEKLELETEVETEIKA
jgi:hypothetical protein